MKKLPPKPALCMCGRVGDPHNRKYVPGKILKCYNCEHEIHVSSGTLKSLRRHPYVAVFVCLECCAEYAKVVGRFKPQPLTTDQLDEIAAYARAGENN